MALSYTRIVSGAHLRAALLTGLNPHRAGYGSVANSDPGFPGLRLELADDVRDVLRLV